MNGNIKGKGTQAEPWLIEDVYDFCELNNKNSSERSYAELVKNLDFNNHNELKYGWTKGKFIKANNIVFKGNGKEIRNIVFKNRAFESSGSMAEIESAPGIEFYQISDVKWVNIILISCYGTHSWLKSNKTSQCSFSITMMTPRDFCHTIPRNMDECTVAISGNMTGYRFETNNTPISRTHFILDLFCNEGDNWSMFMGNCNLDTCYFTGNLKYNNSNNTSNYRYIFGDGTTISSCYFAVNAEINIGNRKWQVGSTNTTIKSACFIDTDLITMITGTKPTTYNKCYCIPTKSAKDKDYLKSIGFPVI